MKRYLLVFLLTLSLLKVNAQDVLNYISDNAIEVADVNNLSQEIYNALKDYQLIMVGEMHGTNEPAEFVIALAELFTRYDDSVQVGFEISSNGMELFINSPTGNNILLSEFFTTQYTGGRGTEAWANAISVLSNNPKVELFFFDLNPENTDSFEDRDSVMYLEIKKRLLDNPNKKTITISGNVHNKIIPHREHETMGYHLINDKELNIRNRICSLTHAYHSGTMYNDMGEGLKVNEVESKSIFSSFQQYERYLILFPIHPDNAYTGYYFTRKVTASNPLK